MAARSAIALTSALLVVLFFRSIPTNGPSMPAEVTGAIDRNPVSAREREDAGQSDASSPAPEVLAGADSVAGGRQLKEDRPTTLVAPTAVTPREIEELKLRYPWSRPIIESAEAELGIQAKDPLWSAAMEARILGEISQKAFGLELTNLQVDCRATLCRVLMVFPHRLLQKKFGVIPPIGTAWTGQQPVGFFIDALDLPFRKPMPSGLDDYGTPVVVGYVERPSDTPNP